MKTGFHTSIAAAVLIAITQCAAFPLPSLSQTRPSPAEVEEQRAANQSALRSIAADIQLRKSQLSHNSSDKNVKAVQSKLARDQAEASRIESNLAILSQWDEYYRTAKMQADNWNEEQDIQAQIDERERMNVERQSEDNQTATEEGKQYYIKKNRQAFGGGGGGIDGWNSILIPWKPD